MSQKAQVSATKPAASLKEIGKTAMKSSKGGLNPQPLPPGADTIVAAVRKQG